MKLSQTRATRIVALAFAVTLPALVAHGQQTAGPAATQPLEDDVVELSPFVVSTESEKGYYSPQAVSGTRTRTELINLPMNLAVFNENFINDIGARDLVDVVSFASGVSGAATAGSDNANGDTLGFTLRGQGGFVPNRNGFRRLRLVDPITVSRVEVLKGPASVLYGQASPGGSVNYITKRPVQRKILSTGLRVGSYDYYSGSIDVNVPTENKKLAVRMIAGYTNEQSWIARYHAKTTVLYPSLTWWIRPETTLTVEFESTVKKQTPKSAFPLHPILKPDDQPWGDDIAYNARGPNDKLDVTMEVFTAEFVHKFNPNLTVRANWNDSDWTDEALTNTVGNQITGTAPSPGSATTPGNPPLLGARTYNFSARGSFDSYRQIEFVNNFTWGGVEVQNLLGYQLGQEKFVQIYAIPPQPTVPVFWNLNDPGTWVFTGNRTDDPGSAASTGNRFRNTLNSVYFTNQLTMMDGKLHTLFGYRVDKIRADNYSNANTANPAQSYAEYPSKGSPQFGVLFKPVPGLSFFGSYSTSIVNLYTTIARREDGSFFNAVPGSGKGFDFGVKADMMKGRLAGALSFYSLEETDIIRTLPSVTVNGETFNPSSQSGTNSSSGVELDLSARPVKGLQLGLAYAYTYSYVKSDVGTAITLNGARVLTREGHQTAYSPRHQVSFNARKDLGGFGPFKSSFVVANGRWVAERQYSEAYFNYAGALRAPWTLDPYFNFNAGVGGQFEVGRAKCTASLMIKNITDELYFGTRNYHGAPRTIEFSLRTNF